VLIATRTLFHSIVAETPDQLLVVAINDLVSAMPGHEDGDDVLAVFFVKEASSSLWEVFGLASIDRIPVCRYEAYRSSCNACRVWCSVVLLLFRMTHLAASEIGHHHGINTLA
jgi:hypothetical protein